MNFIAVDGTAATTATVAIILHDRANLAGLLGRREDGLGRQQSQTGRFGTRRFDSLRVADHAAQHLITAADARHGNPAPGEPLDRFGEPDLAQPMQVGHRALGSRENDRTRLPEPVRTLDVLDANPRLGGQGVEIIKIGDPGKPDHGDFEPEGTGPLRGLGIFQGDGIFFREVESGEPGHDPQHGHAAALFKERHSLLEERRVAAELVHDQTADERTLLGTHEPQCPEQLRKHPAPFDIADQHHGGARVTGNRHIHDLEVPEVPFRRTARALQNHQLMGLPQAVEGRDHDRPELLARMEIGSRVLGAPGTAAHDDLRTRVGLGLQENWVHIGRGLDPGRGGLELLRTADFRAVAANGGVIRHVLRFERRDANAAPGEDPAERRDQEALAH